MRRSWVVIPPPLPHSSSNPSYALLPPLPSLKTRPSFSPCCRTRGVVVSSRSLVLFFFLFPSPLLSSPLLSSALLSLFLSTALLFSVFSLFPSPFLLLSSFLSSALSPLPSHFLHRSKRVRARVSVRAFVCDINGWRL